VFKNTLIIGSGTMGLGVACIYALQGLSLTLLVRNSGSIKKVKEDLVRGIERIIRRNKLDENLDKIPTRINYLGTSSF